MFPYVRGIRSMIFSYALLLLFSRFFLAAAMAAGISLVQALPFGLKNTTFPYVILLFLIDLLGLVILLGPITVIRWAKAGVSKLVIV